MARRGPARKIVAAIDFSEPSERALDAAIELALDLRAQLILVHAFTSPPRVPGMTETSAKDAITQVKLTMEMGEAVALSTEWAQKARSRGLEVETVAHEGDPVKLILDTAKENAASLIVVGRHGWGGVKRFFLGSVAQGIVKQSSTPILVVPTPVRK